jgi:predicted ATPase/class 3 adenylate cyclase
MATVYIAEGMAQLPTGTVTFLFTDIEGSTRMLQELGDGYTAVLAEHERIIRRAVDAGDGVEVSTGGDSFFVVFTDAGAAVSAAVRAQRDLFAYPWKSKRPLRVRMGIHTGAGTLGGSNYAGIDVNRAARISAAAHGGQLLLSGATATLVDGSLPAGVSLRSVGTHRLKDLASPEPLFDVQIDGLPSEHPPPRTEAGGALPLPVPLAALVGRERELAELQELLTRSRALTLTGPGGIGKTRLAIALATSVSAWDPGGAAFADLSAIRSAALVPGALGQALGVVDAQGGDPLEAIAAHLRDRRMVLVADNCEQIPDLAPVLNELLGRCSGLRVVATSRSGLGLPREQEYPVPPLAAPDPAGAVDPEVAATSPAVALFVQRAREVDPAFALNERTSTAVGEITAHLDGLPLAIELAAGRTSVLSVREIAARLGDRLGLLSAAARTAPERQRTLRGAIAWSEDLLEEPLRALFARCSVFAGGFTLPAMEEVADPAGLGLDPLDATACLVQSSLIRRGEDAWGGSRFTMLQTIAEYAAERLAAHPDPAETHRRHADHYLLFAEQAEPNLTGDDQRSWLDRCETEHPNVRAALRWAIDAGEADRAQGAAGALWRFWQQRGHLAEGREWCEEVLAMPSGRGPTFARAKALTGAGGIAWWQFDRKASRTYYGEALTIQRELGDPARLAEALYNMAFVLAGDDDLDGATRLWEESLELYRAAGDETSVASVLVALVTKDAKGGAWDRVVARIEEVVGIRRRQGGGLHLSFDLVWLAFAYGRVGRSDDAWTAAEEGLDLFREGDNPTGVAVILQDMAFLALWDGRFPEALRFAGAAEAVRSAAGGGPMPGFAGILEGDPAAEARSQLPAVDADAAWREGLEMDAERAVEAARRYRAP